MRFCPTIEVEVSSKGPPQVHGQAFKLDEQRARSAEPRSLAALNAQEPFLTVSGTKFQRSQEITTVQAQQLPWVGERVRVRSAQKMSRAAMRRRQPKKKRRNLRQSAAE